MIGGLAAGGAALVGRALVNGRNQRSAARAAGLQPAEDLSHLPPVDWDELESWIAEELANQSKLRTAAGTERPPANSL